MLENTNNMVWIYVLIILVSCAVLIKSTDWVIKSLTYIAKYLKLPEFVIAFILAGPATSLPELFVGILAGLNKVSILSLSNVLGSNIADVALVLGLTILLARGLKIERKVVQFNIIYTLILLIYPLLLLLDKTISRLDGLALLVLFGLYVIILYRQSKDYTKTSGRIFQRDFLKNVLLLIIGIVLLLGAAEAIVKASQGLAIRLNIQLFIIGVFLVALGTSLPELSFNLRATKEHKEMIFGNILGSLAANSSLILGVTAIISPIVIENLNLLLTSVGFMLASFIFFMIFARTKERFSWFEGMILILFYIGFLIIQPLIK